jgi:hypothetical protein
MDYFSGRFRLRCERKAHGRSCTPKVEVAPTGSRIQIRLVKITAEPHCDLMTDAIERLRSTQELRKKERIFVTFKAAGTFTCYFYVCKKSWSRQLTLNSKGEKYTQLNHITCFNACMRPTPDIINLIGTWAVYTLTAAMVQDSVSVPTPSPYAPSLSNFSITSSTGLWQVDGPPKLPNLSHVTT